MMFADHDPHDDDDLTPTEESAWEAFLQFVQYAGLLAAFLCCMNYIFS